MASTYTGLGVQLMTTGEKAGTWGTLTNTNWDIIEQISGGYTTQALTDNDTVALAKNDGTTGATLATRVIKLTGTLSVGNATVTVPDAALNWWLVNNAETNGTHTVTFQPWEAQELHGPQVLQEQNYFITMELTLLMLVLILDQLQVPILNFNIIIQEHLVELRV